MTNKEVEEWIHGTNTVRPERDLVMAATAKSAVEDLRRLKMARVSRVMLRGSKDGKDCAACQSLIGIQYNIDSAPLIPPTACTCEPWCMLVYVARA